MNDYGSYYDYGGSYYDGGYSDGTYSGGSYYSGRRLSEDVDGTAAATASIPGEEMIDDEGEVVEAQGSLDYTSNEFSASPQVQRSLRLSPLLPRQQRGDPFVRLQLPCAQEARL